MKTLLLSSSLPAAPPPSRRRPRHRAFSLVEVTLALGIVTFGLVGIVGVLPTALASGRQSFDQNRAAAIASTVFASFRSQSFSKVAYVDEQFSPDGATPLPTSRVPLLNLDSSTQASLQVPGEQSVSSNMVQFYVTFLGVAATDTAPGTDGYGTQRRLVCTTTRPGAGTSYLVTLLFNNAPEGMAIQPPADNRASNPPAQANRIDLLISPANEANQPTQANPTQRPIDQYHFVSTIASRSY